MAKPKVSVIIPVYNVEPYLRRCVDSVLAQTLTDIEIFLVDDGSPDGCPAVCDEYAVADTRIKVIHKTNGGLSSARNAGLDAATGEYIAFVDSDDWIDIDMYEMMLKKAESFNADIVTCNFSAYHPDRIKKNVMGMRDEVRTFTSIDYFEFSETFGKQASIYVWNSLYRHKIIKQLKLAFQPTQKVLSEDQLFNLCFYPAVECAVYINESYYNYLVREGSLSHKEFKGILNARITSVQILQDFIKNNHLKNQQSSFYAYWMWSNFVSGCSTIHTRERMVDEINLIDENRKLFNKCLKKLLFGKAGNHYIQKYHLSFKASLYFRYMLILLILGKIDRPIDTFLFSYK